LRSFFKVTLSSVDSSSSSTLPRTTYAVTLDFGGNVARQNGPCQGVHSNGLPSG
jgi:hypothetical protein